MSRQVKSQEWARQKARKTLSGRSSSEWLKAIDGLRCSRMCRLLVAQIVWFDYFSKKPATPHDATLDLYKADWEYMVVKREPIRIRATSLMQALMNLGYAKHAAVKRAEVIS